jgi:hypothetical protein
MAAFFVFPTRLFSPASLQARLLGAAISGGASLTGDTQVADLSGGGRWAVDFGASDLLDPAVVKAWRALSAAADSGVTQILVPLADRLHQPVTPTLTIPDPFGLSIYDDGLTPWVPDQVTATVTADAGLRVTELSFDFTAPKALVGGEHFSILHADWGWRLYIVTRVKSGGAGSGDATVIDLRPPLRQAVAIDDLLNFDSPRGLMRLEGDMSEVVELQRFGTASAKFVEAGKPA